MKLLKNVVRIDEALRIMREELPIAPPNHEVVPLAHAVGRRVAATITATFPVPHFRRSTMDGYAVRARATLGASEVLPAILTPGGKGVDACMAVLTGGAIPEGFDAVVMSEYVEDPGDGTILVTRPVAPMENVMDVGEDVPLGATLLNAGEVISPHHVGVLAAEGISQVPVSVFRVGVLATGNEVVPMEAVPLEGQIRDLNSHLLCALLHQYSFEPHYLSIARDDESELRAVLAEGLDNCDALVMSGGSSAGALDFTERVIMGLPGGKVLVHGLAVKPGKPTILGTASNRLIIGLPGHPLSCAVMAQVVALPLLCHCAGFRASSPARVVATLSRALPSSPGRRDYVPVCIEGHMALPLLAKSAAIEVLAKSDGLLVLDEDCEGLNAGATVTVELWR